MTFDLFKASLSLHNPEPGLAEELKALWYDANGNWEKAHEIAQAANDTPHCLIHAYLHRKEGDTWNAGYWYKQANRKMPSITLNEEWEQLVKEFLHKM